jgi:hypothetical protein
MVKRIYLDTDMWNALFYQGVNPPDLMRSLQAKGSCLVFSSHNLYEIAKSFHGTRAQTKSRGVKLVEFLLNFFDGAVEHPVDHAELLRTEVNTNKLLRGAFKDEVFVKASGTDFFKSESKGLLGEPLRTDIDAFISNRKGKVEDLRNNQKNHFAKHPELADRLRSISRENLSAFLTTESRSSQGLKILEFHLRNVIPGLPPLVGRELANILVHSGVAPFTHSLVRATLYTNWRAANYGALAGDVPDDMYHMLGATYCDLYATGEAKQIYAKDLLASKTRFASYPWDQSISTDDWLVGLV